MMITTMVLGLAVLFIATLFYQMQSIQTASQHLDSATRAAQTEIEVLRNNSYTSLVADSTIDFTNDLPSNLPKASGIVKVKQDSSDLKRVDVTVSYYNGNDPQQVTLSSTIGVIGIGQ
jgi:hypothetical protein